MLGDIKTRKTIFCTTGWFNNVDVSGDFALWLIGIGRLDLSNARIGGALELHSPPSRDLLVPCLEKDDTDVGAMLILQDATVGLLSDNRDSWPKSLKRELDGFKYSRLGEIGKDDNRAPFNRSADWFIQWLAQDASHTPQPYVQLARVMEASGQVGMANDIRFARWERP